MILITVELLPNSDRHRRQVVARARIENDHTGDRETGNYVAVFEQAGKTFPAILKGFPRRRLGPWALILQALRAANVETEPAKENPK